MLPEKLRKRLSRLWHAALRNVTLDVSERGIRRAENSDLSCRLCVLIAPRPDAASACCCCCWAAGRDRGGPAVVTFPGSALGEEGQVLQWQLARFAADHPAIRVVQRPTPDAADQRHQLYVQWLNAGAGEPDILQLDAIWTPEFAAAGWIMDLDRFRPPSDSFFPATIAANRWHGRLYALPWFVDVGMLYWRTDLMRAAPATFAELERVASQARTAHGLRYGLVWQGARYEGLVTVFSEYLGGFGGRILDGGAGDGRLAAGVQALTAHADADPPRGHRPRGRAHLARGGVALRVPEW